MTKRQELQADIKTARTAKKDAFVAKTAALKALRAARAAYTDASKSLAAARAALTEFDNK